MATTKKTPSQAVKKAKQAKTTVEKLPVKAKTSSRKQRNAMNAEMLIMENISALTSALESLRETLEMLVQKTESIAYHTIANEAMLAEIVADNGINLARVNARIRLKIDAGSDGVCDSSKAIDVAAAIASPLPRR